MSIPVNKVTIREKGQAEDTVIIDLSSTSASPLTVQSGKKFFSAAGVETLGLAELGGGKINNTELSVAANGVYTPTDGATGFEKVTVNVTSTLVEINTEAQMDSVLANSEPGQVYKYTGTTGRYENGNYYVVE